MKLVCSCKTSVVHRNEFGLPKYCFIELTFILPKFWRISEAFLVINVRLHFYTPTKAFHLF